MRLHHTAIAPRSPLSLNAREDVTRDVSDVECLIRIVTPHWTSTRCSGCAILRVPHPSGPWSINTPRPCLWEARLPKLCLIRLHPSTLSYPSSLRHFQCHQNLIIFDMYARAIILSIAMLVSSSAVLAQSGSSSGMPLSPSFSPPTAPSGPSLTPPPSLRSRLCLRQRDRVVGQRQRVRHLPRCQPIRLRLCLWQRVRVPLRQ